MRNAEPVTAVIQAPPGRRTLESRMMPKHHVRFGGGWWKRVMTIPRHQPTLPEFGSERLCRMREPRAPVVARRSWKEGFQWRRQRIRMT